MATWSEARTSHQGDPLIKGEKPVCSLRLVSMYYDHVNRTLFTVHRTCRATHSPEVVTWVIWRWKYHGIAMAQKRPTDPKQSQIMANRDILSWILQREKRIFSCFQYLSTHLVLIPCQNIYQLDSISYFHTRITLSLGKYDQRHDLLGVLMRFRRPICAMCDPLDMLTCSSIVKKHIFEIL